MKKIEELTELGGYDWRVVRKTINELVQIVNDQMASIGALKRRIKWLELAATGKISFEYPIDDPVYTTPDLPAGSYTAALADTTASTVLKDIEKKAKSNVVAEHNRPLKLKAYLLKQDVLWFQKGIMFWYDENGQLWERYPNSSAIRTLDRLANAIASHFEDEDADEYFEMRYITKVNNLYYDESGEINV